MPSYKFVVTTDLIYKGIMTSRAMCNIDVLYARYNRPDLQRDYDLYPAASFPAPHTRYNRPDLQRDYDAFHYHVFISFFFSYNRPDLQRDYDPATECHRSLHGRYNRPDLQRDYDLFNQPFRLAELQKFVTTDLIYKGIMTLRLGNPNL